MQVKSMVAWALAVSLVVGCSSGTTPTTTPTAVVRQPTASATPSPSASPTSAPTASATETPAVSLPTLGPIDTFERCTQEGLIVSRLDLPRQIISMTPGSTKSGTSMALTAQGFRPNTGLEVRVFVPGTSRVSQPLTRTLANESGQTNATFTMPDLKELSGTGNVPVCVGIVLWSPSETGGATFLVTAE